MSNVKHIVNESKDWAKESLRGYVLANNKDVVVLDKYPNVLVRKDHVSLAATSSRVALISGGGSGHEPAHVGFVAHGMLTAVVCGDLFASPSVASILAAVRFVSAHNNNSGVLLIVKNYTGDRLNFGMAAKRAQFEGILVDWLLVDDDVALIPDHTGEESQQESSVGRRGLCGTVLVHKLAGALAEQRKPLSEIKSTLERILNSCKNLRTIGVSLSGSVPLPGAEKTPTSQSLESNQIEIGMGIHGENGRHRMGLEKSAELMKYLLDEYLFKNKTENQKEQQFCLMVNNLGGLSVLESYVIVNDCVRYITEQKLGKIRRLYVGALMTSLNMNGFSLTILKLGADAESTLELLDQKTNASAWPKTYAIDTDFTELCTVEYSISESTNQASLTNENQYFSLNNSDTLKFYLKTIAGEFASIKDYLNELDSGCGDGDCGNSLASAAEKIIKSINDNNTFSFAYPHQVLLSCANIFESCGGSLCILLALFLTSAASSFRKNLDSLQKTANDVSRLDWLKLWSGSINKGLETVEEYGRARPGQRSIVDPLDALNRYLKSEIAKKTESASSDLEQDDVKSLFQQMVDVTFEAAQATAHMKPMVGRASYVDPALIKNPDAGAFAISVVVSLIYKAFLTGDVK